MPCNTPHEFGDCQFNVPEEEIYTISDDCQRCIFHLGSARALNEEEMAVFSAKMEEYVRQCIDVGESINLLNVPFHTNFPSQIFRGLDFSDGINLVVPQFDAT